jgi:pimeloyl-ACP methyl ester carboxylesterase
VSHVVSRALPVDCATLHVVEVGPREGAPLVVVHGGPGEAHDALRPHLDALASPARRLVYYDQRGGGRSRLDDGAAPGGVPAHIEDLAAVARSVSRGAVDLLGFSWGALLAVLFALDHPAHVARLVLVSPPPLHADGGAEVGRRLERAAARPEVEALGAWLAARALAPAAAASARRLAPCFADPRRALDVAPVEVREDVAAAVTRSLGRFDLRPRLAALRAIPVLVVQGDVDPVAAPFAADTARRLGASLAVVPGAGHAPFVEAPEAFGAAVRAFLG